MQFRYIGIVDLGTRIMGKLPDLRDRTPNRETILNEWNKNKMIEKRIIFHIFLWRNDADWLKVGVWKSE